MRFEVNAVMTRLVWANQCLTNKYQRMRVSVIQIGCTAGWRGRRGRINDTSLLAPRWPSLLDGLVCPDWSAELGNTSVGKKLVHFSICACHPCAGAMLIFSVSFQF